MLARDEKFLQGLPFFSDVVMPASAKAVDTTIRWPDTRAGTETARNLAFKDRLDCGQYLVLNDKRSGYGSLMNLLTDGHRPSAALLAEVTRKTINWHSLERDALVIDLGPCSPCPLELADLCPHLRFEAICPPDKLDLMTDIVTMKSPSLMNRIQFRFPGDSLTRNARAYLLVAVLGRKSNEEVVDILREIFRCMDESSRLIIVDTILPDPDETPLAMQRMWHCCDMTMRQLQNAGHRTLSELKSLAEQASNGGLSLNCHTFRPGTTIATVVFGGRVLVKTIQGGRDSVLLSV